MKHFTAYEVDGKKVELKRAQRRAAEPEPGQLQAAPPGGASPSAIPRQATAGSKTAVAAAAAVAKAPEQPRRGALAVQPKHGQSQRPLLQQRTRLLWPCAP